MRNVFQMHRRETIKKETQNLSSYIETCNPIVKSKGKHNHTSYGVFNNMRMHIKQT